MRLKKVMWRDNVTNQQNDLVHSIYVLLWSFWNAWVKSVVKVFLYNCLTRQRSQTAASSSEHSTEFIVFCNLYENYCQWRLLVFLVIFSLSGSDDFILFDSVDGNRALFANVLCDIIYIFYCLYIWGSLSFKMLVKPCSRQLVPRQTHKI